MTTPPSQSSADRARAGRGVDPRVAIGAFLAVVAGTFAVSRSQGLALLGLYIAVLYRIADAPPGVFFRALRTTAVFALLVLVINGVIVAGRPLPIPGGFLSEEGLARGAYYALRVAVLYLGTALFLSVVSHEAMAAGVSSILGWVSPALGRRAAFYVFLTMGFLPLFGDEIERVRTAQRFRGGGIVGRGLRRIEGVRLLLVPLFVSAIRRSEQLAIAAEIRDVRSSLGAVLVVAGPRRGDVILAAATVGVVLAAARMSYG